MQSLFLIFKLQQEIAQVGILSIILENGLAVIIWKSHITASHALQLHLKLHLTMHIILNLVRNFVSEEPKKELIIIENQIVVLGKQNVILDTARKLPSVQLQNFLIPLLRYLHGASIIRIII